MRPPQKIKIAIREASLTYAKKNDLEVDESRKSALIFKKLDDALCPASMAAIRAKPEWLARTTKVHTKVPDTVEMQSSNSSDGLLMSIFCHPKVASRKKICELMGFSPVSPTFGQRPKVKFKTRSDRTEIDMAIDEYLVEAKLTEANFKEKDATIVSSYDQFETLFFVERLKKNGNKYCNYQVIRNLLAATEQKKRHMLICDERRPDLVRDYYATVACLRDVEVRSKCRVVFWQEIARAAGEDLREFLEARYGIC